MADATPNATARDPELYEAVVAHQGLGRGSWDIDWYVGLARETRGPILEVGAGTGRVLTAVLETGADAVGIELDDAMYQYGRRRLEAQGCDPARMIKGDMLTTAFDRSFSLVMVPYNTICVFHGPEALGEFMSRVNAHTTVGSRLALDIIAIESEAPFREVFPPASLETASGTAMMVEDADFDPATRILTMDRTFDRPDGSTWHERIRLHVWRTSALRTQLARHGWEMTHESPPPEDPGVEPWLWTWAAIWARRR